MSVFDRRYEMMPRAELEQLQLERLQSLLARLKRNVRRYRERIADQRLASLADLARLPFTTPEEVAESFPYGLLAFPLREVIRLHTTAGPAGKPLVIGHTRNDLTHWGRLVARQLAASGVTAHDVIQICLRGSVYPGASGYLLGAELIGASVIAEDPFQIEHQLAMLQNYRPTVLITTPTNARDLMALVEQRRIDPQSLHLRTVLLSRPVESAVREHLAAGMFAAIRCNFGIGEVLDPGFCLECEHGQFHVQEDHYLVETPEGELVVTTLTREAMPLLRYRSRIACEVARGKCPCGRTGAMLQPGSRLDRRLWVNEVGVYETQIADLLAQTKVAGHQFQVEVAERHITIVVEMSPALLADTVWFLEGIRGEIESEFLARLGIEAKVRFVNPRRPSS